MGRRRRQRRARDAARRARPGAGAACRWSVRPDMVNGHDLCHGGLIASLADSAFALACNSHGPVTVAAGFEVDFLEPARLGPGARRRTRARWRCAAAAACTTSPCGSGSTVVAEFRGRSRSLAPPHLTGPRRRGTSRARRTALPWDGSVRAGRSVMKVRWLLSSLVALVLAAPLVLALGPASSGAERASSAPTTPVLVAVRAAHRDGVDRVVFEFRGRPARGRVRSTTSTGCSPTAPAAASASPARRCSGCASSAPRRTPTTARRPRRRAVSRTPCPT